MRLEFRYRILGEVGQGQFGRVLCAIHRQTGQIVALKDLEIKRFPTSKFLRELSYIITLEHPHIVPCIGLEYHSRGRYLVMDYCEGGTLRELIESNQKLSLGEVLKLVKDILLGLSYAHDSRIIHCDIKPENILLKITATGWIARISDFGIARLLEEDYNSKSGGYTGSPAYMAPERFYGKHSPASDLYAVGVILFEVLAGKRPFNGYPGEIMTAHLSKSPQIPETIPTPVRSIIEIALRKLPQRRFRSAGEMVGAIEQAAEKLGINLYASAIFSPPMSSTYTNSALVSCRIINCIDLPILISYINVASAAVYLGGEDCIYIYKSPEYLAPMFSLEEKLVEFFSIEDGVMVITKATDYKIIYNRGKSLNELVIKTDSLLTAFSLQGKWLAIADSCHLQILKLPQLTLVKEVLLPESPSELINLDNRHGILVIPLAEAQTQLRFFNRRCQWFFDLNIPLSLFAFTANAQHILALDKTDPDLAILINLKPFKVTYIVLEIQPDFILAQPWGFILVEKSGRISLIDLRGKYLGHLELREKITAIAPLNPTQFLVATQTNSANKLYTYELDLNSRVSEQ